MSFLWFLFCLNTDVWWNISFNCFNSAKATWREGKNKEVLIWNGERQSQPFEREVALCDWIQTMILKHSVAAAIAVQYFHGMTLHSLTRESTSATEGLAVIFDFYSKF